MAIRKGRSALPLADRFGRRGAHRGAASSRPSRAFSFAIIIIGVALTLSSAFAALATRSGALAGAEPRSRLPKTSVAAKGASHGRVTSKPGLLPVAISIPDIGLRAPVVRLGLNLDRTVQVPTKWETVGWFTGNPVPGSPGAAVLLGHRDSKTGPAAFYRLPLLRKGNVVVIRRANKSKVRFVITHVKSFDRNRFPTKDVYGKTAEPTLRLVTCGGDFDRKAGRYRENVVAFARLVKEAPGARWGSFS